MEDDHGVEIIGENLKNKNIALLVTGGIAAYKSPSLVRHFRQYGANVQVYLTDEAKTFVTEMALEWASTNKVISKLTSDSEHLFDYDAYVAAPATYNTIGKFAAGIADNAVTTTLASALGKLDKNSVLVAPTMHSSMENPIYKNNLEKLANIGVKIIEPVHKMGKATLPESHYIVAQTIREMSESSLKGKKILVTAGPTPGRIDNVRAITNKFRGRLGIEIAEQLYLHGADVKLLLGASGIKYPRYIDTTVIRDFYEYYEAVMKSLENKFDIGIFSAAAADYIPREVKEGKIPSKGALKSIELKETPKVIKEVRQKFPELFMVTFKYEDGITREKLEEIAKSRINEGYQLVVANRAEEMKDVHKSIVVDETGIIAEPATKRGIAKTLTEIIEQRFA